MTYLDVSIAQFCVCSRYCQVVSDTGNLSSDRFQSASIQLMRLSVRKEGMKGGLLSGGWGDGIKFCGPFP